MAKQNIPKTPDRQSKTPPKIHVSIKGSLPKIPPLPRQSGVLNSFTFDLVHKMILEQGEKDDHGCVFQDGTQKFFAPLKLDREGPGLVVENMESRIFRCYIHSDFENDPEVAECFQDTISITLVGNLFFYLTGQIPGMFHGQMDKEIEIQFGYLSTEEKREVMDTVGEQIQEFRQADGRKGY